MALQEVMRVDNGKMIRGGGTSNYNDLTNKPSINGVTLSGNKTTSDLGIDKTAVGLGNVPNVSTNDQTPTFTEASTRNNIANGEKLSVIFGKIQKFFNDLKTVAFSGNASDLNYDNTTSGLSATDVQGAVDELKSALESLISRGEFNVYCNAGRNIFSRSTVTLINGTLPPNFLNSICMVINHSTVQNSPNTIEADGADTFIIHAVSAQNITVRWLDLTNVPRKK